VQGDIEKCDLHRFELKMLLPSLVTEEQSMNAGRTVFAQVMDFLPKRRFQTIVERYHGEYKVRHFSCLDQFLCMAFAQLTYRESLRDIEACLSAQPEKLYHLGIRTRVRRSTLADANETRDWRIFADLGQVLIQTARDLYAGFDLGVDLDQAVYALDSTTIDLCLALFPWAKFRRRKGGIKLHTLLDLRGSIPSFILVSPAKMHDVNVLDVLLFEPGAFYIFDRGYIDFVRLYHLHQSGAFFVTRSKKNTLFRVVESRLVEEGTGVRCDQTIRLTGLHSQTDYAAPLRRITYRDAETGKVYVFLSNNFLLSALTIAQLYKARWQVELFFKWIKQHLRIKAFLGTSDNAVKTQVWIAVSVYVIVAILKKRLLLDHDPHRLLQILSVHLFEKTDIQQLLTETAFPEIEPCPCNQLSLFD